MAERDIEDLKPSDAERVEVGGYAVFLPTQPVKAMVSGERVRGLNESGVKSGPPFAIIKKLGGDDPLEDFGDLALGLVVSGVLELVLGRVVERARRHVGPRGRVAERQHPPLGVLAAQYEVDEDLRGIWVRRVLHDREQR